MSVLRVAKAVAGDAPVVRDVIRAAFAPRPQLEPATTALDETVDSVAEALRRHGGLICTVDGEPAGVLLFATSAAAVDAGAGGGVAVLRRLSVVPHRQSHGVASALVDAAEEVAAVRGYDDIRVAVRAALPETMGFWRRRGYAELDATGGSHIQLGKALPFEVFTADADATRAVGGAIGACARAGDVVVLTGELGAGKTTFVQGLGVGLGVRGDVTSPTFVISRVHPSLGIGPALVHVDAYRLGDGAELDDLDLDSLVAGAVTVVEWGEGIAEALSDDRLRVHLGRTRGDSPGGPDGGGSEGHGVGGGIDTRRISVTPVGARWFGSGLRTALLGSR